MLGDHYIGFIRLENFWVQDNGRTLLKINEISDLLEENINLASDKNKKLFLIISMVNEICTKDLWYDRTILLIRPLLHKYNIHDYKFIFSDGTLRTCNDCNNENDIMFVDFSALRTYHRSFKIKQTVNSLWNSEPNRALMFIGKINREHRLPLLAKFYEQNLLDYLDWSLYFNDSLIKDARSYVPQFTDEEYIKFIEIADKKLDEIDYSLYEISSHYPGFPFDSTLYADRCVSVIPETNFAENSLEWITEKTYRTIANKHPFIMVATPNTLIYLRSLGFKTFEEYTLIKNYDTIIDPQERLDAVVQNTKYFIENKHKYIAEINADVEHNFTRFCEYCDAQRKKLTDRLPVQDEELTWLLIGQM
jgi:hypothetical protein